MNYCRINQDKLVEVINFGLQPLGNGFIETRNFNSEYFFEMSAGFCETSFMFQLLNQPEKEKMFHDQYAFFSTSSIFMQHHFKKLYEEIVNSEYFNQDNSFVIEIGSNDGIFLNNFSKKNIKHLGIEPSRNVANQSTKLGINTISEFFSENLANKLLKKYGQADFITAANVMCHIPNINDVVRGIKKLISNKGIFIFEDPYLGDVLEKTSYDQIYDEHVFLFSIHSISYLFNMFDMEIINIKPLKTHGGSMRYYIAHKGQHTIHDQVYKIIEKEKNLGLNKVQTFHDFKDKINKSKNDLVSLLYELKSDGKRVAGYGASSKSTTILNYCNITDEYIEYISDTTPLKQNKFSPGKHIPIKSQDYFHNNPPDYAFLFTWNHAKEILEKEKKFTLNNSWITHVPKVHIL